MKSQITAFVRGWLLILDGLISVLSLGFLNGQFAFQYALRHVRKRISPQVIQKKELDVARWPSTSSKKPQRRDFEF